MYKKNGNKSPLLVIFDREYRNFIFLHAHKNLGHRGIFAVYEVIRHQFYWPQMRADGTSEAIPLRQATAKALAKFF